jgi:hypothetical protein
LSAIGVQNAKLTPKSTASTNGSGATPRRFAIDMAIGVPITAAELFETMFAKNAISSTRPLMTASAE